MKKDCLVSFDDTDYECVDRDFKPNEPVDIMPGINHAGAAVAKQWRTPVTLVVDFVEGHPVFDLALVALEDHL